MPIFYKDHRLVHMSQGDSYLWSKFLDKNEPRFSNYRYDVHVGTKVLLPAGSPEWLIKSASALSDKRIDVVMEDPKTTYVVEVKVNAKSSVVGDLIVYRHLYIIKYNPIRNVRPVLVADTIEADLLIALKSLDILFFLV